MVHVVMYWYYFQSARGIRIWWKQYITVLQIVQFIIDLGTSSQFPSPHVLITNSLEPGFVYFASWTYFTDTYWPWLSNNGHCSGEEFAAIAGICILSSYLVLFISFYAATYRKPASEVKTRGRARSALKEMASENVPTVQEATRRLSHGAIGLVHANGFELPTMEGERKTRSRKA
jgi:fatty acid elongase 3